MATSPRRRALVTGASSGIGLEIARALAARGFDLVITARRQDALTALASELRAAHGIEVEVVTADLAASDGASTVWQAASAAGARPVDVLVNNAGFGYFRSFSDVAWPLGAGMVTVNITALTELSHHFIGAAKARGERSHILNIASTASFQPIPDFAVYAATKAYVRNFSEALSLELANTPISVTCVCPGGVTTEFIARAGYGSFGKFANMTFETPATVARISVEAMLAGKRTRVIGLINRLGAMLASVSPRAITMRTARHFLGKMPEAPLPDENPAPPGQLPSAAQPSPSSSTPSSASSEEP